jgi:hypothetical protein
MIPSCVSPLSDTFYTKAIAAMYGVQSNDIRVVNWDHVNTLLCFLMCLPMQFPAYYVHHAHTTRNEVKLGWQNVSNCFTKVDASNMIRTKRVNYHYKTSQGLVSCPWQPILGGRHKVITNDGDHDMIMYEMESLRIANDYKFKLANEMKENIPKDVEGLQEVHCPYNLTHTMWIILCAPTP